jgi:hypothetical protein
MDGVARWQWTAQRQLDGKRQKQGLLISMKYCPLYCFCGFGGANK